jgi:hypothetical protein
LAREDPVFLLHHDAELVDRRFGNGYLHGRLSHRQLSSDGPLDPGTAGLHWKPSGA